MTVATNVHAKVRERPALLQVRRTLGSSSSFTACVHEVALNETDLCIGNFWYIALSVDLGL